jgi:glycosyltransferase involved in cell wall biosynthesis
VKVGLVVPGGVDPSGRERVIPALLWLVERLAARHDVVVFALGQEEEPGEWPLLGARVVDLGRARRRLPGRGVLERVAQLSRSLRREGPFDVVHAFWASPCGFLATLAAPRRTPIVVSLAGGELAAIPEIGYGCSLVARERWKVGFALRRAAAVTGASEPILRAAAAAGVEGALVPLGVEADGFPSQPRPVARDGGETALRLLHVGSLNRVKDQATLLHAFALARRRVPALLLDVLGEDTLSGQVQELAARLGLLDAVTFHGWLPTDEVRPFFARADLLVVSSLHEAGPVALVEAAAFGVPTAGTAVGHVAEGDGVRSLAVPVGDAEALADALVTLASDAGLRARLGAAAFAWARENDADRTAARFGEIYRRVSRPRPAVSASGPAPGPGRP